MNRKIFVSASTFAKYGDEPLKLLDKSGLSYFINPLGKRLVQKEIIEMGDTCEGVIAGLEPYDDYVLDNMPNLRCISRCGVGLDNISLEKAKEKGIKILNTPDVVTQPVAELTLAMALDLLKRISWQSSLLKSGQWNKKSGNLLFGKKFGILGLGRIGKRVAEIMVKLGAQVYGTDISPDKNWANTIGIKLINSDELLKICDILSIHLSIDKDNPFKLGKKEISIMKKGAIVINVSRGVFIDEDILYDALKQGRLAGAALDVFVKEPYEGKLRELENVVLTPHIATLTVESRLQMEIEATKNIINFFKNE
ncbi:MAG: hypothetical protein FJZ11_02085 [Candidatus Omnitrophica bacterium]|nr:hypothetical protein [Candidatus Omnitrophota bacterium]